ncbi:MAG: hypothetical protein ACK5M3_05755 [Dysgonomonas sp.]
MKKNIFILLITAFVISLFINCTNKEKKDNPMNNTSTITSVNLVHRVVDSVRHYPQEPIYYIFITNMLCNYEILVNDFLVERSFSKGVLATPVYINMGILKSGPQKLTYRLYPFEEVFRDETRMTIELGQQDRQIDSDTTLLEHRSAYTVKMVGSDNDMRREVFIASGEKYYEHTITFDATVPYENKGWLDGQDLRKFDRDELYQAVLKYHQDYKKIYETKNADKLAQLNFRSILEFSQSEYKKEREIQEVWNEYLEMLNIDKEFPPMDNIKMSFYGDSRMVCLEHINEEPLYKNRSAFYFKYKKGGNIRGRFIRLYLYLPKGKKDLSELEIAM